MSVGRAAQAIHLAMIRHDLPEFILPFGLQRVQDARQERQKILIGTAQPNRHEDRGRSESVAMLLPGLAPGLSTHRCSS
ncbi:MAG TPA: hypothetical protein VFS24_02035 [Steroidobacteraceae bacterium]|nr:hypothetical protein [Steroidobacteraceae bacterium]